MPYPFSHFLPASAPFKRFALWDPFGHISSFDSPITSCFEGGEGGGGGGEEEQTPQNCAKNGETKTKKIARRNCSSLGNQLLLTIFPAYQRKRERGNNVSNLQSGKFAWESRKSIFQALLRQTFLLLRREHTGKSRGNHYRANLLSDSWRKVRDPPRIPLNIEFEQYTLEIPIPANETDQGFNGKSRRTISSQKPFCP